MYNKNNQIANLLEKYCWINFKIVGYFKLYKRKLLNTRDFVSQFITIHDNWTFIINFVFFFYLSYTSNLFKFISKLIDIEVVRSHPLYPFATCKHNFIF